MTGASFWRVALKSLASRRGTALLTVASIALSTALFLVVDKIRHSARAGFESTVSGVDLIVGARTNPVTILLFSVFGVGAPSANVSWESYELISQSPAVAWSAPLALGDSHRGFRVMGTTGAYFQHYRYGEKRPLAFAAGAPPAGPAEAAVGAAVARSLGYDLGDAIVIAHGLEHAAFAEHKDEPFLITGVLAPTGTPVDRTVIVTLEGLDAVHGLESGAPHEDSASAKAHEHEHEQEPEHEHEHDDGHDHPQAAAADAAGRPISAFLLGLKSRGAAIAFQRDVNAYRGEALAAAMPGAAIAELWSVVGQIERALLIVAGAVIVCGLIGLITALLAGLGERRREIAIMRALGASPADIARLLIAEAAMIAFAGALIGAAVAYGALAAAGPVLAAQLGTATGALSPGLRDGAVLLVIAGAGAAAGAVPAWRAYRQSLADGLSMRL